MTTNSNVAELVPDRVKLPFSFDVTKMQADIQALALTPFNYYDAITIDMEPNEWIRGVIAGSS